MKQAFDRLPAAYVRGVSMRTGAPAVDGALLDAPLDALTQEECEALYTAGKEAGLKMYRFKDHAEMARVQKVLGFLRGVWPESLLDVGSGRGVFLFPFLRAFPDTPVTALDVLDYRVAFLNDIRLGGVDRLTVLEQDICRWDMPDKSFDVVTMLEVLEHIPDVESAIRAAVRLARRFVVVTVPSKPDDNPEHIHLLTKDVLTDLFGRAGCTKLSFDGVNGHLFMAARLEE
ncbi:MAG: class I SAM-dependent methyltransferase [Clostridia bacterium]|nr:class I SAM-dependent methyltransferase [Clostridia bacterium]